MKKHIITMLIIFIVTLTSCQLYPQPEDTISKPKPSDGKSVSSKDISSIVANFLPEGTTITDFKDGTKPIQTGDMDGDGTDEIIAVYKEPRDLSNMGILVLKKGANEWENIFMKDNFIRNISKVSLTDITGDNNPELFVEHDNNLSICMYINEKVYNMSGSISTDYRIEDLPGMYGKDDMLEVIVRDRNTNNHDIKVLRWVSTNFEDVTYEYPDLKKEMKDFYNKLLKSNPKSIDALLKVSNLEIEEKNYTKALELIEKAEALNKGKNTDYGFGYKKATCLLGLGKYDEAIKICKSMPDNSFAANCYLAQKKYDKAREVIKSSSQYPYDERIQSIDAAEAKDKIFNFINASKDNTTDNMLKSLVEWGNKENIVITCSNPNEPKESKFDVFLIDYSINPSKSFGKEGVGEHLICWIDNSKPFNTSIHQIKHQSIVVLGFYSYKASNSSITVEDAGRLKIKITYAFSGSNNQYKLPVEVNKTFRIHDNFWKEYWN